MKDGLRLSVDISTNFQSVSKSLKEVKKALANNYRTPVSESINKELIRIKRAKERKLKFQR